MAGNVTKPRKKRQLECPLLTIATTPLPPRVVCCVFGCRSTDRDAVSFHPLPTEPDRLSQWLKLINRQDLLDRRAGRGEERVCSRHFPPPRAPGAGLAPRAAPSLLLPATSHEFVHDGSSELLQVKPEIEIKEETEENIEIEFELEQPSNQTPEHPADPLAFNQRPEDSADSLPTNQTPEVPADPLAFNQLERQGPITPLLSHAQSTNTLSVTLSDTILRRCLENPVSFKVNQDLVPAYVRQEIIIPQLVLLPPIKKEPAHFGYQSNSEVQTNVVEALYRTATFSAVEQINIPSVGIKRKDVTTSSSYAQTSMELVESLSNDIRRQYGVYIEEANKKLEAVQNAHIEKMQFLKGCDKYLDVKLANFIKSHVYFNDMFDGRHPKALKEFALKLYLTNPKTYTFVEKFFGLPSKKCIESMKTPMKNGKSEMLLCALKTKVEQMSSMGKMCAVTFDVMCLKKSMYYDVTYDYLCGMQEIDGVVDQQSAEYAAVISVRGIYSRWKQPVAFALVGEKKKHPELKLWIHKTIYALFDIGLNVKVLVYKCNDPFLDVSITWPYLDLNKRKVYQMYDVPTLFKIARDELMQYDFDIDGTKAKWSDIVNAYDIDKERELKVMPQITESHVRINATEKNDVKLATQIFSSSLAAAMHFNIIAEFQDYQAEGTVQFISKMSSLFEIFNSRKLADAYRGTAHQQRLLKDTLSYLEEVKLKDMYGNEIESEFVSGLTTTIKTLMALTADLKKSNVNHLLTKNFSMGYVQSFFDEIKRLCDSKTTPIAFTRAFRKLFIRNLLNNTKTTASADEMNVTLSKIAEYVDANMEKTDPPAQATGLSIDVTDYKADWPSNEYITGYIISKCLEKHCCEKIVKTWCDYYMFDPPSKDELIKTFQFYNADNIDNLCKIRPPVQLRSFVNHLESKFNDYFKSSNVQSMGFGWNLYTSMENDICELPCPCFPIKFFKMLYIRLKIYNTAKMYKDYKEIIIEEEEELA